MRSYELKLQIPIIPTYQHVEQLSTNFGFILIIYIMLSLLLVVKTLMNSKRNILQAILIARS